MNIKDYLKKAEKEGWAIGQFNASNLETAKAIFQVAQKLGSPVIIGTSKGESQFFGVLEAATVIKAWQEKYSFPVVLNLDHAQDLSYIKKAVESGYDFIHFDGSRLNLAENIERTKEIVKVCRKNKVFVEGEVGLISGSSTLLEKRPEIKKEEMTLPEEAERFIKETGVDSLAINIGAFHGMVLNEEESGIDLERLKEIKARVKDKILVLHGGSGIPPETIRKAIQFGITKININTEIRKIYTQSLKEALNENPNEITPYKYLSGAANAIQGLVEEKIKLFGSNNKIC